MLNRSTSLAMSTNILKALPGKLDIKRHSPGILYVDILFLLFHFVFVLCVRFCCTFSYQFCFFIVDLIYLK